MSEREKLIKIIKGLIANIKTKNEKYGSEYCGGLPIQFAIHELKQMGIDVGV